MTEKSWFLLNESRSIDDPGDMTLFKTESELTNYMEPIDVSAGEYYVIRSDGLVLIPRTDEKIVWLENSQEHPNDRQLVHRLVQHLCDAVREAHPSRSPEKLETLEEMAEFVGFYEQ